MKKLILILSICLCGIINDNAQALSLQVINKTGCDVYYTLYGDFAPSCAPANSSAFISLSAAAVYYSDPTAVPIPPLGPTDQINGAVIYSSLPGCAGFSSFSIGEPCSGWPATGTFFLYKADCSVCVDVRRTATWTAALPPLFVATLTIN